MTLKYQMELKENYNKIIKVSNDNLLECLLDFERKLQEVYDTSVHASITDTIASEIALLFNRSALNIAISLQKILDERMK